jgi:hypothetical protein
MSVRIVEHSPILLVQIGPDGAAETNYLLATYDFVSASLPL